MAPEAATKGGLPNTPPRSSQASSVALEDAAEIALPDTPPSSPDLQAQTFVDAPSGIPELESEVSVAGRPRYFDLEAQIFVDAPESISDLERQLSNADLDDNSESEPHASVAGGSEDCDLEAQNFNNGLPGHVSFIESRNYRQRFGNSRDVTGTDSHLPYTGPEAAWGQSVLERTRSILSWHAQNPEPLPPVQHIHVGGQHNAIELMRLPSQSSGPSAPRRYASRSTMNSGFVPRMSHSNNRPSGSVIRAAYQPPNPVRPGHEVRRIIHLNDPNVPYRPADAPRLMDLEDRDDTVQPNFGVRSRRYVARKWPHVRGGIEEGFWPVQQFLMLHEHGFKMSLISGTLAVSVTALVVLLVMMLDMWFAIFPDGWALTACGEACEWQALD